MLPRLTHCRVHSQTLQIPKLHSLRTYADNAAPPDRCASAKLFQDAANEEAELAEQAARAHKVNALATKHENWDGEESMQDAVLRMLVDKYKPLRSGPIQTAEEKLKESPPKVGVPEDDVVRAVIEEVRPTTVRTTWGPSARSMADVPLLPSIEGHQPWHTTFSVPSHAQSSIKYGTIPPSSASCRSSSVSLDDKARRMEREAKKRNEHAGRLLGARESTLDYKLGIKGGKASQVTQKRRPNPVSMKGWASLVEERIEVRIT